MRRLLAWFARRRREIASAILEVLGLGLLVAAALQVSQVLGLAVAGAAVLATGIALGGERRRPR